MFWGCVQIGIAVLNTVKLLCAVLAREQGTLCRPPYCQPCVVGMWFRHFVGDTVFGEFWENTVGDTVFGDIVATGNMPHCGDQLELWA